MIEDEIEQAKQNRDEIDISNSPYFVKDVENGSLVFYKDRENYYLNFASDVIAKNKCGEEGKVYFEEQKRNIRKNKAEKLNATETQELLKRMRAEKNYRYQYFG